MSPVDRPSPAPGPRAEVNRRLARAVRAAFGQRPALADNATTDMRLRHVEADVAEVRARVNGLFFAVLGSLALEVIGKVAL